MARAPGGPGSPGNEMSWEEIWQRLTGKSAGGKPGKPPRRAPFIWIGIIIVVVIWLLTGIYTVGPGEQGIVRRFGDHVSTAGPGLHYHLPSPIEHVDRVNIEEIRTTEIGFRTIGENRYQLVEEESHMLTEDENIVKAQVVVQYKVNDAAAFLFNVLKPEQVIHDATEVALRSVVGDHTIDFVMIEGRTTVQAEVKSFLQTLLDDYGAGISVTNLKLQDAGPPEEVREAFNDVQAAREDKQTLIRESEGYAADRVPKARGEAQKAIMEARAYREQRVLKAEGDAAKFLQILKMHEVPAAFKVLADDGVEPAIDIIEEMSRVDIIATGTLPLTTVPAVFDNIVAQGTGTSAIATIEQHTGVTRDKLYEILNSLGVTEGIDASENLTGKKMVTAFERLGLAAQFQQAYENAIKLTEKRLYIETLESVLPVAEKFIVDASTTQGIMPFLPLKELSSSLSYAESGTASELKGGDQ